MTTRTLTIDEFLALPETEPPSEFVRGEVIQKVAPSPKHAFIVAKIVSRLERYLADGSEAVVFSEARHVHREDERVFLPDINVTLSSRLPRGSEAWRRAFELTPDFAIEVLSPDDRPGRVLDRIAFFLDAGVRLIWFVDPDDESLIAHSAGEPPHAYHVPDVVPAAPILPGFVLDLGELFGQLHARMGDDPAPD
jgi:Uma2 family endonuclease